MAIGDDLSYMLFLDDLRAPPDQTWIVARSYDAAVHYVEHYGMPSCVSFDHDLGEGATGLDFAHWLIDRHLDGEALPDDFAFAVHSRNPIGGENITALMRGFLRHIQNVDTTQQIK